MRLQVLTVDGEPLAGGCVIEGRVAAMVAKILGIRAAIEVAHTGHVRLDFGSGHVRLKLEQTFPDVPA